MDQTTNRLTIANDWHRLKPWAEEIALCNEAETQAERDLTETTCILELHRAKVELAKDRLNQAKLNTREARMLYSSIFEEMVRGEREAD